MEKRGVVSVAGGAAMKSKASGSGDGGSEKGRKEGGGRGGEGTGKRVAEEDVAREMAELREQVSRLEGMLREREKGGARCVRNDLERPMGEWGEGGLKKARNRNEEEAWRECEKRVMEAVEAMGEGREAKLKEVLRVVRGRVDLLYDAEEVGWFKACKMRGLKSEGGGEVTCFRCGEKGHLANRCWGRGGKGRKGRKWEESSSSSSSGEEESESSEEERRERRKKERKGREKGKGKKESSESEGEEEFGRKGGRCEKKGRRGKGRTEKGE